MKVGSSLRGGGVGVWVEGRFVAEEPEPLDRAGLPLVSGAVLDLLLLFRWNALMVRPGKKRPPLLSNPARKRSDADDENFWRRSPAVSSVDRRTWCAPKVRAKTLHSVELTGYWGSISRKSCESDESSWCGKKRSRQEQRRGAVLHR